MVEIAGLEKTGCEAVVCLICVFIYLLSIGLMHEL